MEQLIDQIKTHLAEVEDFKSSHPEEIERFRIKFLGKKGILTGLFAAFKDVPKDQKKTFGQQLNSLKVAATNKLEESKKTSVSKTKASISSIDFTRPGQPIEVGALHPISILRNQVVDIFSQLGFSLSAGPEIEDDWHNFTALNLPEHHPARDMQDTFLYKPNPTFYCARTPHRYRCGTWRSIAHPYERFHQGECFEMRIFLLDRIVCFIKWRACISIKPYPLLTSSKPYCISQKTCLANQIFAYDHRIFLLPNPVRRLIFIGACRQKQIIALPKARAGWKSWVVEWLIPKY